MAQGSWVFLSESDPRWRRNGRGQVGMFCSWRSVPEAAAVFAEMKQEYGEPPADLEWAYCKD